MYFLPASTFSCTNIRNSQTCTHAYTHTYTFAHNTDTPLSPGAFANCAALSQQLGHVFGVRAAQQASIAEAEAQITDLRRHAAARKHAMTLAQVRAMMLYTGFMKKCMSKKVGLIICVRKFDETESLLEKACWRPS